MFSCNDANHFPNLMFEDVYVNFVERHKNLGLTPSSNAKWHAHTDNIITFVSKLLGIMRAVKYKLSRKALNNIYISYTRHILEYAAEVWDGCAAYEKTRPERIQSEATRIVTGLTKSVSIDKLIKEIGWLSLLDRCLFQKVVLMYNIINGLAKE